MLQQCTLHFHSFFFFLLICLHTSANSLKSVLWLFDPQSVSTLTTWTTQLTAIAREPQRCLAHPVWFSFDSDFHPPHCFSPLFLSPSSLLTSPLPCLGSGISGWYIYSGLVQRRRCLLVHNSISSPICFQVPGLQNTSRSLNHCCAIMFFKGPEPLGRFFCSLCGVMTQTCRQGKDVSEI